MLPHACSPIKSRMCSALRSRRRVARITPCGSLNPNAFVSHLALAKTQKFDHKRRPSRSLGFGFARLRPARAALWFRVPLLEYVIGSEASAKAETEAARRTALMI